MAVIQKRIKVVAFLLLMHIVIYCIIYNKWNERKSKSWQIQISSTKEKPFYRQKHRAASNSSNLVAGVRSSRWVVISLALFSDMSRGYEFCLPIVVAAWKRIGWHSLIFVVDNSNIWHTSNLLKLVREETLLIDPTTKFVIINVTHNPVSYAQVSRLFATIFAPYLRPDDILMTTDIDLIPIKKEIYDEVRNNGISLLNTECCGMFPWNNTKISMQPMAHIAMNVDNWKKVMDIRPLEINETHANYINSWLSRHYGKTISDKNVVKGGNVAWFLDQRVVSVQLNKSNLEKYKRRKRSQLERVDRARPRSWNNFRRFMDAHMYYDSFKGNEWNSTFNLIKDIFASDIAESLKLYRDNYVKLLSYGTDN